MRIKRTRNPRAAADFVLEIVPSARRMGGQHRSICPTGLKRRFWRCPSANDCMLRQLSALGARALRLRR